MNPAPLRFEWLRLAIFIIAGMTLCWLVVAHTGVAYLASVSPDVALKIHASDSQSLMRLATEKLQPAADQNVAPESTQLSPSEVGALREKIETALVSNPLSSHAYHLMGQIAEIQGPPHRPEKFMQAATRRSLNEKTAVVWMMNKSLEWKNYRAAIYYADVLLRSTPGISTYVTPVLARMAENPDAKLEIQRLLATNPRWRGAFFSQLGASLTDARTPLDLFLSLKDSTAPPTTDELNAYEAFLIRNKLYEFAYNTWLQFLPPEQLASAGYLYNGDFEKKPSGSAFDWRAPAGANVIVDFASRPQNAADHALVVDLGPGRVEFPGVSETIMLAPGDYTLKGSLMGEIRGPRGIRWSVKCVQGATVGQSELILGSFPDWRTFEFPLVVPENGCSVQTVELKLGARTPSEKLVFGAIWFDDLSISRQKNRD